MLRQCKTLVKLAMMLCFKLVLLQRIVGVNSFAQCRFVALRLFTGCLALCKKLLQPVQRSRQLERRKWLFCRWVDVAPLFVGNSWHLDLVVVLCSCRNLRLQNCPSTRLAAKHVFRCFFCIRGGKFVPKCAMQQLQTSLFAFAVCYHAYTFLQTQAKQRIFPWEILWTKKSHFWWHC